uniref:Techylectin-5B-like n=1 Tax=Crassostrea virginica TaxID=6565 RepID=A0A8B8EV84_CRAVI|nr:techylectin-5B-like [Crassostrea virginica]
MSYHAAARFVMILQSVFILAIYQYPFVDADDSLYCLSCSAVISPRHCHNIIKCDEGQVCYTEEYTNYNGETLYSTGCHSPSFCNLTNIIGSPLETSYNQIKQCVECCSENACNSHGCNSTDYPLSRGPLCFSCQQTTDPSFCRTVQVCNDDEVCHIHEVHEFGERFFSSSCLQRRICNAYNHGDVFGRRRYLHACSICCENDLCNDKCTRETLPFDCLDVYRNGHHRTGVYSIYPQRDPNKPVKVRCEMDLVGGGWTAIQVRNRNNPAVYFNTTWNAYKMGFGDVHGNYWLGNDLIHLLTTKYNNSLLIRMKKVNNDTIYEAHYSSFSISREADGYRLHLGTFSGSITDAFRAHSAIGNPFSTYDHDNNNKCSSQCASGWWYLSCTLVNLNAPLNESHRDPVWNQLIDEGRDLLSSEILIKRNE